MEGGGDGIMCGLVKQYAGDSFLLTWATASAVAFLFVIFFSGIVFYKLYWPTQVTYEKWMWKTNPKFPTPEKVRDEIIQTTKCVWCAAICPSLALYMYANGDRSPIKTYGYCGTLPEYGWSYNLFCFFLVWLGSDFFEFFYHYLGHRFAFMWNFHRHHHVFFNPTPFSVIADEFMDQFARAMPLLVFPMFMVMNLDVLYFTFTILFYGTGVYHHCGYERSWPNAHTGFFNTSYHHYLHHSISIKNKPYHCGFMFKIYDELVGSCYNGECFCVICAQKKGLRSREEFEKVEKQDYTKLLQPSFWVSSDLVKTITGTSGADVNEELASKEKEAQVTKMETNKAKLMTAETS